MRKKCLSFLLVIIMLVVEARPAFAGYAGRVFRAYDSDGAAFTVTFNAGGVPVTPSSVVVRNGEEYGELPTPSRGDYLFDGWYTEENGGVWITRSSVVNLRSDQVLYAHWTRAAAVYIVTFNAGEGELSETSKTVTNGGVYGELPTPVLEGSSFEGWFTSVSNGGVQITRTTVVNLQKDQTLYARYKEEKKADNLLTIRLDPMGGTVEPSKIDVTVGESYGDLPTPVWSRHIFEGWYTNSIGGDRINSAAKVTNTKIQRLYARWSESVDKVTLEDLTYQFPNSREGFEYAPDYKMGYKPYEFVFGDRAVARAYFETDDAWGGNCYGMSLTSALLFKSDSGVTLQDFNAGASSPADLTIKSSAGRGNEISGMSLLDFIEAMQVSQKASIVQNNINSNRNKLPELCGGVQSFQKTGNNPVIIALARRKSGHAVLGYSITEISDSEAHLNIYDSNFPGEERYITLYKSNGAYTGWAYNMNNQEQWGSHYEGSWISYITYSEACQALTNHGGAVPDYSKVCLFLNTENALILDADGNQLARIQEGDLRSERSDVYPMLNMTSAANNNAEKSYTVWLPVNIYSIVNQDPNIDRLRLKMVNLEQYAMIETEADKVTLYVDDRNKANCVILEEPGKYYDVALYSSLSDTEKTVNLKGVTGADVAPGNEMSFAQIGGKLRSDRVSLSDFDHDTQLSVNGLGASLTTLGSSAIDAVNTIIKPHIFSDVPPDSPFAEAIQWAVQKGITNGRSQDTFAPNEKCSRGNIITFLWRAYGSRDSNIANPFSDVSQSDYYYAAAKWAYEKQLVYGDKFEPDKHCTRAEAVWYLWKLEGSPVEGSVKTFQDVPTGEYYAQAISWAVYRGITNGTSDDTFEPNRVCSRAQIVTFLYRCLTK